MNLPVTTQKLKTCSSSNSSSAHSVFSELLTILMKLKSWVLKVASNMTSAMICLYLVHSTMAIAALPYGPYSPTTCDGSQYQVRNQRDFSVEARIASNTDSALQWQAGVYMLDIDREVGVSLGADLGQGVLYNLYNGPTTVNPTSQLYHDDFTTEVTAIFALLPGSLATDLIVIIPS